MKSLLEHISKPYFINHSIVFYEGDKFIVHPGSTDVYTITAIIDKQVSYCLGDFRSYVAGPSEFVKLYKL